MQDHKIREREKNKIRKLQNKSFEKNGHNKYLDYDTSGENPYLHTEFQKSVFAARPKILYNKCSYKWNKILQMA